MSVATLLRLPTYMSPIACLHTRRWLPRGKAKQYHTCNTTCNTTNQWYTWNTTCNNTNQCHTCNTTCNITNQYHTWNTTCNTKHQWYKIYTPQIIINSIIRGCLHFMSAKNSTIAKKLLPPPSGGWHNIWTAPRTCMRIKYYHLLLLCHYTG